MVDYTETSNANLEDITKVLEDIDSLDMELFNDSFKKSKSSTSILKDFNTQSDGEIKKKVIFKESNEDDLLNSVLSDEEISRDQRNLFTSNSKSSLIEDLFKINSVVTSKTSIKSSNEGESKFHLEQGEANQLFSQKPNNNSTSKSNFIALQSELSNERNTQLKNVSKNEEDILANLIDKSNVIDRPRKSSIKENFFENKSHVSPVNPIISKNIKKVESETMIQSTNTMQDSKSDTTNPLPKYLSRESRRGRRNTKIISDPLGLLSVDLLPDQNLELLKKENVPSTDSVIENTKSEKLLPEWLGGSKKLEVKNEETTKINQVFTAKQNIENHDINGAMDSKISDLNNSKGASIFSEHVPLLFSTQLNQQNALVNMQQQEHELRTTALLSQQNEQLNKVSDAQHCMLRNQEEQFNALLKLQFEKQTLLEKQIKMQQERINQYIHALMIQPVSTSSTSLYSSCKSDSNEKEKEFANEKEEMKNIIEGLEEKKSELEIKLSNIYKKHDNEITFQAEFYERQISFLKEAIIRSEERVKQEIKCLETDYMMKFEKLKDDKLQIENQYKEEIHTLKNEHTQLVEELCRLHSENVKLLQKEYLNIIESISKAKQTEDQIIQTMTNRKTDIEDVLQKVNVIVESMVENKNKLENKHHQIIEFQENTLKMYEDDIKIQKSELKYQNNVLEEHRNKFIEITEKLDIRFTQFMNEFQKQNILYNQAQETLDKKTTDLLREKQLFEEKMKWERDYIQTLKQSWIKEQEKQLKLLAEEKEAIATEKAQLEVLSKLKSNRDDLAKVEFEEAVKIAEETTVSANQKRLKWQEEMNKLNIYKQILQDKENLLILRAKELENLTQSALTKKEEGLKALRNAKHLENQNKEKFIQLQMQIQALMEREKKVAVERYNITKDKMVSLTYETEKPERDINVSHNFQDDITPFPEMQSKSKITTELTTMVDPNLIMLKLNFNDEIDSINTYL